MEEIKDKRLTPTMKRVRSGKTQLFREPNIDNRFTDEDNAAAVLVHPTDVAMYAELIDNKWYWVTGCAECKGEPRDWMTYVECDKHNRCSVCHINTKDLPEGVGRWGNKTGWICSTCHDEKKAEVRREAFEKFDSQENDKWDFYSNDEPICPHCGTKLGTDELYETQDVECHVCEGIVEVEVEFTPTYTTSIKGERITK